eukprot:6974142-Prymnesium_polylepis.1
MQAAIAANAHRFMYYVVQREGRVPGGHRRHAADGDGTSPRRPGGMPACLWVEQLEMPHLGLLI